MGRYEVQHVQESGHQPQGRWSKRKGSQQVEYPQDCVRLQGFQHGTERSVEEENEMKQKKVGFFRLFRFADSIDYALMTVGIVAAFCHGVCLQLNFLFLGDVLDTAMYLSKNGTCLVIDCPAAVDHFIKDIVLKFCTNGSVIMLCGYIHMMCWCSTAERQIKVIRRKAFQAVLRQHMGWFDRHQSGELNTRLTNDVNNIYLGMGDKVSTFVQWTSTFVAAAILCLVRAWELTLVMFAVSPLAIVVGGLVSRALQAFATQELSAYAAAGAVAEEVLTAVRTVTAYGGQEKECTRYAEKLQGARSAGVRRGFVNGLGQGVLWLIVFGIISLAFYQGTRLIWRDHSYTMGILMQVQYSVFSGTRSISFAIGNLENFSMARGGAATVFDLIDTKSKIDTSLDIGKRPDVVKGDIVFDCVTFAYPTRPDLKVLQDLSLHITPGQTVALVGPSGCGKSTVIQLLQRFYQSSRGNITLDRHSLQDLNVKWLRQQIGVVSQEPILFATTIRENILFGKDNATQEEIEQAAQEANAHNFIMNLPDKYETMVGAKGAQLSGGQKQRVAIARALVRNPKVLLLDDATSALDYQSESVVQEALDKARRGRTTVIVAHRLSTIRSADVICVMNGGRVMEVGSHDQLLAAGGVYHRLISGQAGKDDKIVEEPEEGQEEDDVSISYDEVDIEGLLPAPITSTPKALDGDAVSLERSCSLSSSRQGSQRKKKKSRRNTDSPRHQDSKISQSETDEEVGEIDERGASLGRIFQWTVPEVPFLLLGCLAAVCQGALFPAIIFFSSEILAAFTIEDREEQKAKIHQTIIFIIAVGAMACLSTFTMISMFTLSGERLTMRLRNMAFRSMLRQEMGWFDDRRNQVGSLTSRLATDASMVKAATGAHLSTMINASSTAIFSTLIAFLFGWKLALLACAFLPPLIGTGMVQTRMLVGYARGNKESIEEGGKLISEAVENIRTVAALTKEDYFSQKYDEHFITSYRNGLRRAQVFGVTWGLSQSILFFAYAANYSFGAHLIGLGEMKFYNVYRVFVAISSGAIEIGRINSFASDYSKAKVSAGKLFALFDRQPLIDSARTDGKRPASCRGEVGFHDVRFRYPSRPEVEVLSGLNVAVQPGRSLALVGASGCGKSTTIQLLERFYDPESGTVTLDGEDISSLSISWLRSQIGIVAQEPTLFEDTIHNNIAYGAQERKVPIEEIIEAAKAANIHNFIDNLPMGYETFVGAKGAQLVGGQKQRIAIARALIRNPKILLLDEATSALDTDNEKVVQEALDLAQEGRTSIVIAHRLSTIENANIIAVIDEGHVVELGQHSDLMAQRGLYFTLQMIQRGVKRDH